MPSGHELQPYKGIQRTFQVAFMFNVKSKLQTTVLAGHGFLKGRIVTLASTELNV